ncbi:MULTISPECIES: hypothetical protein [unclassified Mameliella]|uniref:hypothetical protein n=1 Tax=unclassified Mameliella TaxID=2630630 RepID=UPI00273EC3EE|nr:MULTISPECIES: hypothetical protein [unclassified Mameliella]
MIILVIQSVPNVRALFDISQDGRPAEAPKKWLESPSSAHAVRCGFRDGSDAKSRL